jgi:hypothetical protein
VHELGITQGIIDRAREAAQANGALRVTDLYLTMTPAADFSQDSIEMYFEMLAGENEFLRGRHLALRSPAGGGYLPELQRRVQHGRAAAGVPAVRVAAGAARPDAPMVQLIDVGIDDGLEE